MVDTHVNALLHPMDSDNTKVLAKASNYDSYDYYSYDDDYQWTTQFKDIIFLPSNPALPTRHCHSTGDTARFRLKLLCCLTMTTTATTTIATATTTMLAMTAAALD